MKKKLNNLLNKPTSLKKEITYILIFLLLWFLYLYFYDKIEPLTPNSLEGLIRDRYDNIILNKRLYQWITPTELRDNSYRYALMTTALKLIGNITVYCYALVGLVMVFFDKTNKLLVKIIRIIRFYIVSYCIVILVITLCKIGFQFVYHIDNNVWYKS